MVAPLSFVPTEGVTVDGVDALLRGELACPAPTVAAVTRTYLDTFDGRLFAAGLVLEHEQVRTADAVDEGAEAETATEETVGPRWLRLRPTGTPIATAQVALDAVPRRPDDLPAGRLRDTVAGLVVERALLPVVTTVTRARTYRVLGAEEKTVVRVVVGEAVADGRAPLDPVVTIAPIRGYDDDFARVVAAVTTRLGERPASEPFVRAARAIGVTPGVDPADPTVVLDPEASAAVAVVALLDRLFAVLAATLDGVQRDLDIEFLHDYRVAVRRARSLLRGARDLFPPEQLDPLVDDLRWLGSITTPVRDLDVHLAEFAEGGVGPELEPLCRLLEADRAAARAALLEGLRGQRYEQFLDRARRFVRPGAPLPSEPTVLAWSQGQIAHVHRTLVRTGKRAEEMEELHEVRKRAKRLRYTLEASRSLYAPKRVARSIRELKALQDVLGRIQDGEVHAAVLRNAGRRLAGAAPETLMAIGALAEQHRVRQDEAVEDFAARFRRFHKRWQAP